MVVLLPVFMWRDLQNFAHYLQKRMMHHKVEKVCVLSCTKLCLMGADIFNLSSRGTSVHKVTFSVLSIWHILPSHIYHHGLDVAIAIDDCLLVRVSCVQLSVFK